MKVFKFGGASVKDAESVKNAVSIIQNNSANQLFVIVSAMDKTTNALEGLLNAFFYKTEDWQPLLEKIKDFHFNILKALFSDEKHAIYQEIHNTFVEIEWQLEDDPIGTFDFEYDQMVSIGEVLSSKILSAALTQSACKNKWIDARDLIRTDNNYRAGVVDWKTTNNQIQRVAKNNFTAENQVLVSQGFIASTSENYTSTLGREGSDFSAAIVASALDAEEVVIWKDVEGMLNADPKFFENTIKLNNISYKEAVELAYFGASVIHPKTIKPLENKGIPLFVKSFINPNNKGTLIDKNTATDSLIPSYIHKPNQVLISISPRDFSFIEEENLSEIFGLFFKHGIRIAAMQNSAISFSVCTSELNPNLKQLIDELKSHFKVSYNNGLSLLTIRHYDETTVTELTKGKENLMEQRSRNTARFVLKPIDNNATISILT